MVRQLAWYVGVGTASTGVQAVLYLLLRLVSDPAGASAVALLVTTVANTEAHRHWTFGAAHVDPWRAHLQAGATSVVVHVLNLALTTWTEGAAGDPLVEVVVLTAVSAATGLARFVLLRTWVFRRRAVTR